MSSAAEIDFISSLSKVIDENRSGLIADQVEDKHGEMHDLQILPESATGPRTRPCIVLIADGGGSSHERVSSFELRFESLYQVDDFDEATISTLQRQLAALVDDKCAFGALMYQGLADLASTWCVRKIQRMAGNSEVDSQRGRGVVDKWMIWMVDDQKVKSADLYADFVYTPVSGLTNAALAARLDDLEEETDGLVDGVSLLAHYNLAKNT